MNPAEPPVVALVGPTGAGKSAVALEAARQAGAEIVAVDAFTVYRGMDVGTAKPTAADRAAVAHHMIDVLEPEADCTVEWFQTAARDAVTDVGARRRPVLLVGGSGLYFRAVVDPLEFPPTDPRLRDRLLGRWREDPAGAHAQLARLDPAAAALIDPANLRRTVRALEVIELTGRPFSSWRRAWDEYRSLYPGLRVVGLEVSREELRRRIAARTTGMIERGLLEETRRLAGRPLSVTARQAIGYAEVGAHLAGEADLAATVERIEVRTRRYAARQQRWFRADPRVQWTAPDDAVAVLTRNLT